MGYVHGFTVEVRDALTAIAEEQGLPANSVRPTTWNGDDGWIAPDSVVEAYANRQAPKRGRKPAEKPDTTPTEGE